jgi:hypothetical protein
MLAHIGAQFSDEAQKLGALFRFGPHPHVRRVSH